jgi:predicted nuclease of restriction endonuclease-like (RecB) superfamily
MASIHWLIFTKGEHLLCKGFSPVSSSWQVMAFSRCTCTGYLAHLFENSHQNIEGPDIKTMFFVRMCLVANSGVSTGAWTHPFASGYNAGMTHELVPSDYLAFLQAIKTRVQQAQLKALVAVNKELILLYWQIGRAILERQREQGWGAKVIDQLSKDLHTAFPEMKGFSPRNLKYMRAFAQTYPDEHFVQQVAAQIPWFHHCVLLDKVKDEHERAWYIQQTIAHGWSRYVMEVQIETGLFQRKSKALTNFKSTLPSIQSDLAHDVLKDPYVFDFITTHQEAKERHLQSALLAHIQQFLLELGVGFSFVGSNYHLVVGDEDFYLDLLFYHLQLRCFVVIELKTGEFRPEYAGKMNFYLTAVDRQVKYPSDNPTIGIILCKSKNKIMVEYALADIRKPVGVASYQFTTSLPEALKDKLPGIEEIEEGLKDIEDEENE